jgi:hypothetical protein
VLLRLSRHLPRIGLLKRKILRLYSEFGAKNFLGASGMEQNGRMEQVIRYLVGLLSAALAAFMISSMIQMSRDETPPTEWRPFNADGVVLSHDGETIIGPVGRRWDPSKKGDASDLGER